MRYNSEVKSMEFFDGTNWVSLTPAGSMQMFGGVQAQIPNGWLICDGSEVSRTDYAALFEAIGTNFGEGDGATTFHLPDLRGRFARGTDNGGGNDPDAATRAASNTGGNTGDAVGSLQNDELGSHNHGFAKGSSVTSTGVYAYAANNGNGNHSTLNTGGSETRPKNVSVNYIIKF
jgi:microcystin-dependent protein